MSSGAQAHWVRRDLIVWNARPDADVTLHHSGAATVLAFEPAGLPHDVAARFPHIAGLSTFRVPPIDVAEALRGELVVSSGDGSTSLQIPGVLDDVYAYDGPLGVAFDGRVPTLRLWAPTARAVALLLDGSSHPMTFDATSGVWSVTGDASWYGRFYQYQVDVFVRSTGRVEHNVVTDPYSVSLACNSARSQIIDLDDPALKPHGWDALVKPPMEAPEDIALYELHVRDFSANDDSVPAAHRGTFLAFTDPSTNGMRHLAALAASGLTHVHLLPVFDIATVDEDRSQWRSPGDLAGFPADSEAQQEAVMSVADRDAYNWGYDPWHYTVPEGSYATNPEGPQRILEFRAMVQGLVSIGLRVVMDVVYNHTHAAGQNAHSVLDRIVPGYYHRLDADGNVTTSTCCPNTASEHPMMEKLLIDSVLTWAKQYKVDGFRFDLMGHHMKRNLVKLRAALDPSVYLYGEGWNFGEVVNNARGENATQFNMSGTGIGTFSDRIRDGVRGGGPFDDPRKQGFISGLYFDPNGYPQGSQQEQKERLLMQTDWLRLALAGNLKEFPLVDRFGNTIRGDQLEYNGQRAGYASDPQEVINYIEAHDNDTLFDALQFKLPATLPMPQRVRAHNLGVSIVALAQGIPFFHGGMDMLRSKSGDRNSFNSGDWFNRLDFTYATNYWGVGLPPRPENGAIWDALRPLLGNRALRPASDDIMNAVVHLREMLAIRRSTPLFRLRTAADVMRCVRVLNGGPDPVPGLIVVVLRDESDVVVALFNAAPFPQSYSIAELASSALALHPVQQASCDPIVKMSTFGGGTFSVPGRTAAVFRNAGERASRPQSSGVSPDD